MDIRPDEITNIIKGQIEKYSTGTMNYEESKVIASGDGIARIYGLKDCMQGELLEFENGVKGIALNLEEDNIGCVVLGDSDSVSEGMKVRKTGSTVDVPVGDGLLGRIVNPLGEALDGKGEIAYSDVRPLEFLAPGVTEREPVNEPLQTGVLAIDSMIPIGRGQRELIIGDRQTGKTAIAIDTIINQRGKDVICIYVAIGQKASTIAGLVKTLDEKGALDYTIIVSATASDSAPLQYIAPYAGAAMAEGFMYGHGKDVLVVYDDLSKHAVAYRQMSLLLRRPPGREAYPGDVFYLHSRLLERAVKLSKENGGGSITAIPIVETLAGDISAYIPTNIISITDGQIFLETQLFYSGQRPAVNVGLSVSRVGGSAQIKAMKKIAGPLRMDLAQYRELKVFSQFGSDLDQATQDKLSQGERLLETIKQEQYKVLSVEEQVIILYSAVNGYLSDLKISHIKAYNTKLIEYMNVKYRSLIEAIRKEKDITDGIEENLKKVIDEFKEKFDDRAEDI